ncbi:polysaccharide pyruvyl transferase family protein [Actinoplanes sp. NPDC049802]|uniref:polysaccharide pyruvyl transferase family protein n=1 Tax=Actinoplanes sp. NPDC049802 TaxID=3154742 RepID=UPI0033E24815
MTKVAILHGYSADNIGDGFLVQETCSMLREVFGPNVDITLFAHKPDSFAGFGVRLFSTAPNKLLLPRASTLRELARLRTYDLVVGVGGGYLRMGRPSAAAKCALVHLPQLIAAGRVGSRAVYLPQSIGPFRMGTRAPMRRLLSRVSQVMARDDRTISELSLPNVTRYSDIALLRNAAIKRTHITPTGPAVYTVRGFDGTVPKDAIALAELLRPFDGFVQSTTGRNNDTEAMGSLRPIRLLERSEIHGAAGGRRVVVAVRLHAALLAMGAGHYVIHLSYERKGFGAFGDLGLGDYVHNVFNFSPSIVAEQVDRLLKDPEARRRYDEAITEAAGEISATRGRLLEVMRSTAGVYPARQ